MNSRRGFLKVLGAAAASFTVLPSALTYQRKWIKSSVDSYIIVPNPAWVEAPYEVAFMTSKSAFNMINVGPPPKQLELASGKTTQVYFRKDDDYLLYRPNAGMDHPARISWTGEIVYPFIKQQLT